MVNPKTHGGKRSPEGGRPITIKGRVQKAFQLQAKHLKNLERYSKKVGCPDNLSAGLRHLLENL